MNSLPRLPDTDVAQSQEDASLRFSGEINYENAHQLLDSVRELVGNSHKSVTLDLSEVEMIDSSGLRALLQSKRLADEAQVEFRLALVSHAVARIIAVSGFAPMFGLAPVDVFLHRLDHPLPAPDTCWRIHERECISDPYVISVLRKVVLDALEEVGASHDTMCDVQIAVGEALTNAYRHGSPVKGESRIGLKCSVCDKVIVIEIQDEGEPFDPDAVAAPDPSLMCDHGMGIYLMRHAMDVVEFACNCPGNRVSMLKWLDFQGPSLRSVDAETSSLPSHSF